eukprot:NODE_10_length_61504_cov_0.956502.p34 type:complete len:204 gc:universal NODE_10_length_61504_cov_0.956502:30626-30015(-)
MDFDDESNSKSSFFAQFMKSPDWAQQLIEQVSDFIYVVSASGIITYASPSCFQVTGFQPNELVGRYLGEFVHPDDGRGLSKHLQVSLQLSGEYTIMHRFRRKNADYIILEVRGKPLNTPQKQYIINVCREYPSKVSTQMDSLISLKFENEQLKQKYGDKLEKAEIDMRKHKRGEEEKICTECGTNESPVLIFYLGMEERTNWG